MNRITVQFQDTLPTVTVHPSARQNTAYGLPYPATANDAVTTRIIDVLADLTKHPLTRENGEPQNSNFPLDDPQTARRAWLLVACTQRANTRGFTPAAQNNLSRSMPYHVPDHELINIFDQFDSLVPQPDEDSPQVAELLDQLITAYVLP